MTLIAPLVSATKFARILATITVASNTFSFQRHQKKYLHGFQSPIDESSDALASFNVDAEGENEFFFGLVTEQAHVEDGLNDAWLQFAEGQTSDTSVKESLQPADLLMGAASGDGGLSKLRYQEKKLIREERKLSPLR